MNQRETEPDGDGSEAFWRALVGSSQNNQQEERRKHNFRNKARKQRIAAWGMRAIAVRGKSASEREIGFATCNQIKYSGTCNSARHLGDDVGQQFAASEALPYK